MRTFWSLLLSFLAAGLLNACGGSSAAPSQYSETATINAVTLDPQFPSGSTVELGRNVSVTIAFGLDLDPKELVTVQACISEFIDSLKYGMCGTGISTGAGDIRSPLKINLSPGGSGRRYNYLHSFILKGLWPRDNFESFPSNILKKTTEDYVLIGSPPSVEILPGVSP